MNLEVGLKSMKTITATQMREDIYNLVEAVEVNHEPIQITSKKGNAILVSKEDWDAIQETLYLLAIPNMREELKKGMKTHLSKCKEEIKW